MAGDTQRWTGTVRWFNPRRGYGFITPDDGGEDLFVHHTSISSDGFRTLWEGQPVEYFLDQGEDGRSKAVEVSNLVRSRRFGGGRGGGRGGFGGRGRGVSDGRFGGDEYVSYRRGGRVGLRRGGGGYVDYGYFGGGGGGGRGGRGRYDDWGVEGRRYSSGGRRRYDGDEVARGGYSGGGRGRYGGGGEEQGGYGGGGSGYDVECYNCGRFGHLARSCFQSARGRARQRGGGNFGGSGGGRGCFNCGEEGHFARDCPNAEY